jgi:hypothetical protein
MKPAALEGLPIDRRIADVMGDYVVAANDDFALAMYSELKLGQLLSAQHSKVYFRDFLAWV